MHEAHSTVADSGSRHQAVGAPSAEAKIEEVAIAFELPMR